MQEFSRPDRLFKVSQYEPVGRLLTIRGEQSGGANSRVEIYFRNVECMLLKPYYPNGIRVRLASDEEYRRVAGMLALISLGADDDTRRRTWLIEDGENSFIVSENPTWREGRVEFPPGYTYKHKAEWLPGPDDEFGRID